MSERWTEATWLGKRKSDDSHICGLPDGSIGYSRSIRIRPDDPWDFDKFNLLLGTPWNLTGKDGSETTRNPESMPFTAREIKESEESNSIPEAIPRDV